MPHYADGSPAAAGDRVRGTTYNQTEEVEGTIAQITSEAAACNAVVQFDDVVGEDPKLRYPKGRAGFDWDYTAVADLERLGGEPRVTTVVVEGEHGAEITVSADADELKELYGTDLEDDGKLGATPEEIVRHVFEQNSLAQGLTIQD